MALLAFAAPRVEPSPGVKETLMRRLHSTAEGPGGSLARSEPEPAGGIFGRWWAVLLPLSGRSALATIFLWMKTCNSIASLPICAPPSRRSKNNSTNPATWPTC